jgi:hypothetical protein
LSVVMRPNIELKLNALLIGFRLWDTIIIQDSNTEYIRPVLRPPKILPISRIIRSSDKVTKSEAEYIRD